MPAARPVVLVVDDEALIVMDIVAELNELGFATIEANNGDDALSLLRSRDDVSVLITDLRMPGSLSGLDLAEFVTKHRPQCRIIIFSGDEGGEPIPDAFTVLKKPAWSEDVRRALQDCGALAPT